MKKSSMGLVGSLLLGALTGAVSLGCEGVLGGSSDVGRSAGSRSGGNGDGDGDGSGNEAVTGAVDGLEAGPPVTLLARLTNAEFVRSLEILLDLPAGSSALESATSSLAPEPSVHGLQNDAATQDLTQVAIAGFERLANAATQQVVSGVNSNQALADKLGCADTNDAGMTDCLSSYGAGLLQAASRKPANPAHQTTIGELLSDVQALQETAGVDATSFESRVLQLQSLIAYVALSPDFLLFVEGANAAGEEPGEAIALNGHEIASRLSFFLAGEPPDASLLTAAAAEGLATSADRIEQVDRLLSRPEGTRTFVKSLIGWLGINPQTVEASDLEALSAYLNAWVEGETPFNEFYNGAIEVPTTDGSTATQQVGVLGSTAYLSSHTFPPTPSFITRGVFVVEELLCEALPDDLPAEAFGMGEMTEREVLEQHSSQPCATCHIYFDAFGSAFQNFEPETNTFDAAFAPLGEGFSLHPTGDISGEVSNLEELGEKMGASDRAPACMAQLFYRHAMRRSLRGGDGEVVTRLVGDWVESDMSLRSLLESIAAAEEFALLYP